MKRWRFLIPICIAITSGAASCAGAPDPCSVNPDQDGDHFNDIACGGTDCDDTDAERYPGNTEVCDVAGKDEDCDPTTYGERDRDSDGHMDALCFNIDAGGVRNAGDDCDDLRPAVHPGSPEVCNQLDDDCDTAIDEMVQVPLYPDTDHDGYGHGAPAMGCSPAPGQSYLDNDCDDTIAGIVPGAMRCVNTTQYEICDAATGAYGPAVTCPGQGICRSQPNDTGVCF